MNALELHNLTKQYDGFSLGPVNLTLPSGCIMGFIGENGAGKSTTIKLILNLIRRDGGEISILGQTLSSRNPALKEQIGVVMDESSFPDNLSLKNVDLILKNCYQTWSSERFFRYCNKFDIPEKKVIREYSRGMKMKLSIAVALSHNSRLLILDEATSGLDPVVRDEILDVFLEFIQDERNSIFISSHIISDLEKICDYITFIHKGQILLCEEKDVLLEQYAIAHCTKEQFSALAADAVIGARQNTFGVDALVLRHKIPRDIASDPASLEEIMLYYVKEHQI
ncbi:MAG: ABC transporter ATP-binding protein [Clostridiaceae bacterium]|nr:ABC transporter ATP-binding protein [Clostridiaceae bacterium]